MIKTSKKIITLLAVGTILTTAVFIGTIKTKASNDLASSEIALKKQVAQFSQRKSNEISLIKRLVRKGQKISILSDNEYEYEVDENNKIKMISLENIENYKKQLKKSEEDIKKTAYETLKRLGKVKYTLVKFDKIDNGIEITYNALFKEKISDNVYTGKFVSMMLGEDGKLYTLASQENGQLVQNLVPPSTKISEEQAIKIVLDKLNSVEHLKDCTTKLSKVNDIYSLKPNEYAIKKDVFRGVSCWVIRLNLECTKNYTYGFYVDANTGEILVNGMTK